MRRTRTHHNTTAQTDAAAAVSVGHHVPVPNTQKRHRDQIETVEQVPVLGVVIPVRSDIRYPDKVPKGKRLLVFSFVQYLSRHSTDLILLLTDLRPALLPHPALPLALAQRPAGNDPQGDHKHQQHRPGADRHQGLQYKPEPAQSYVGTILEEDLK